MCAGPGAASGRNSLLTVGLTDHDAGRARVTWHHAERVQHMLCSTTTAVTARPAPSHPPRIHMCGSLVRQRHMGRNGLPDIIPERALLLPIEIRIPPGYRAAVLVTCIYPPAHSQSRPDTCLCTRVQNKMVCDVCAPHPALCAPFFFILLALHGSLRPMTLCHGPMLLAHTIYRGDHLDCVSGVVLRAQHCQLALASA